MAKLFERLKRGVRRNPTRTAPGDRKQRRSDSDYGRLLGKEVEQASPERAGELAGHPIERVNT
jgi:hypothetical protein